MIELDKAYDHSQVEDKIYQKWLDSGYFNPDNFNHRESDVFSGAKATAVVALPEEVEVGIVLDWCVRLTSQEKRQKICSTKAK